MGRRKDPHQLCKLLTYILGCRPDEFGLVPDEKGFVRVKDLIKAICEEPGWGYVRRSHLNEVLLIHRDHPFMLESASIGMSDFSSPTQVVPVGDVPKLLYHCVRRKAYPVVSRRGIMPMGQHGVFLALTEDMALRMGKRRDPKPVLLTIQARQAAEDGVVFRRQGELIYTVAHIPVGCFTGPPLPPERARDEKEGPRQVEASGDGNRVKPGSFTFDLERSEELHRQAVKRKGIKKDIAWKKEARQTRRKRR
jgi:putative RNA 2'-phosphotransferase